MTQNFENSLMRSAFDEICDLVFQNDKPVETHHKNVKHIYNSLNIESTDLEKALAGFKLQYERNPNETIKKILENEIFVKNFGEVFTPEFLINDMTKKLPKFVWKDPSLKWLDNSCGSGNFLVFIKNKLMKTLSTVIPDKEQREKHILENMLFGVDIQAKNILITKKRLDNKSNFKLNLLQHDALTCEYWNQKFNIIVGNPPYNHSSRAKLGGKTLWDKFVLKSLELLEPKGFLVYVHPPRWRNSGDELYKVFSENNLIFLNINSYQDGAKTFGNKGTNFDWYVLQKDDYKGITVINDIDSNIVKINISKWTWLPNGKFDLFQKLIATNNDEKLNIIRSRSAYGTDKGSHMSAEKTNTHIHPVVYYINKDNDANLWWTDDNTIDHFGISKIIYASGDGSLKGKFIHDNNGKYGMTQFAFGIVDTEENLDAISKILNSNKFISLIPYMVVSKNELNRKALETFKKDFYTFI